MHSLACHPQSAPGAVHRLQAGIERGAGGLSLKFLLQGNLERLRIPEPRLPRAVSGLWERTCCEVFVAPADAPTYHEFNLSPSGEWAAHAFRCYREGAMLSDSALAPRIAVRRGPGKLELEAVIRVEGRRLLIGLAAVIEAADGSLSYWALRHPPGKPDFHHRDAFALEL